MRQLLAPLLFGLVCTVGCTGGQTDNSRGNGSSASLANGGNGKGDNDGYTDPDDQNGYDDPNAGNDNGGYDDPTDPAPVSNGCNWPYDPGDLELTDIGLIALHHAQTDYNDPHPYLGTPRFVSWHGQCVYLQPVITSSGVKAYYISPGSHQVLAHGTYGSSQT